MTICSGLLPCQGVGGDRHQSVPAVRLCVCLVPSQECCPQPGVLPRPHHLH